MGLSTKALVHRDRKGSNPMLINQSICSVNQFTTGDTSSPSPDSKPTHRGGQSGIT